MVNLGKAAGIETRAIISDMNQPLGKAIGNALEVKEAIDVLNGSTDSERLRITSYNVCYTKLLLFCNFRQYLSFAPCKIGICKPVGAAHPAPQLIEL